MRRKRPYPLAVRQTKKRPPTKARPQKRRWRRRLLFMSFKLGFAACFIWLVVGIAYYALSFKYDLSEISEMPQRSVVYDMDGNFYARFSGENRLVVPFDKISNHFVNALIAREDNRFYQHMGVDPIGILRAAVRNLLLGGIRQGGSTITQQLARNSFPLGGRTLHRKLLEAALSFRIETELTKEQILENYINRIYFGSGFYGIETASRAYFGKPASRMDLSEAALLAGLIRSPTKLSPFNDLNAAISQRNLVLRSMQELGFITPAQRLEATRETIDVNIDRMPSAVQDNWAMDAIRRELEEILPMESLDEGGLAIYSTIDPNLQSMATAAVESHLNAIEREKAFPHSSREHQLALGSFDYLQGAAIGMDNRNGAVRFLVGGRDFQHSRFNRAILGHRQIGSSIKPFVYALAFERGLQPDQLVSDERIRPNELGREYGRYNPSNADKTYNGNRPARDGLIFSRNTMTVRVGMQTGINRIANFVKRAGLNPDPPCFPSIFLGAFEASLLRLTSAYTALANNGSQVHPFLIQRVTDTHGRVLYTAKQVRTPLLEPRSSTMVSSILEEVLTRGTGASTTRTLEFTRRASGKTGTTNDFQDAWFVGYSGQLTAGVWVGFDHPKRIMESGTGSRLAMPIWIAIYKNRAASRYF